MAKPTEVASKVRGAIETLRASNVRDRPLVEVLELSHQLADAMKFFFGSLDQTIQGEFRYIADFISKARVEIAIDAQYVRTEIAHQATAERCRPDACQFHNLQARKRPTFSVARAHVDFPSLDDC